MFFAPIIRSSLFCLCIAPLISCNQQFHPVRIEHSSIQIEHSERVSSDTALKMLIQPYQDSLTHSVKQVIGFASHDLEKERPESTLGNWVADAMLDYAEEVTGETFDFALTNYGGLRILSIPAGPITVEQMFELMPFDNLLVVTELSADDLTELLDHVAKNGGWPVSRGIQFTISESRATNIRLKDKPIDTEKTYRVVINDYIANGGSDCHFLKEKPQRTLNVLIRDALIEIASRGAGNQIHAKLENRITLAERK